MNEATALPQPAANGHGQDNGNGHGDRPEHGHYQEDGRPLEGNDDGRAGARYAPGVTLHEEGTGREPPNAAGVCCESSGPMPNSLAIVSNSERVCSLSA